MKGGCEQCERCWNKGSCHQALSRRKGFDSCEALVGDEEADEANKDGEQATVRSGVHENSLVV